MKSATILCGVSLIVLAAVPAAFPGEKPNVLFIAVDDLNHWVGHLGRNPQARTPHIDRLAARGVRFTRSYCAAPACNPSRVALLSGLRPSTTGVYNNNDDWRGAVPEEKTLPTVFRKNGYWVAGAGKIYHGGFDRRSEWDAYLEGAGGDPQPARPGGVGGIRFGRLECRDDELADYRITSWIIEQLRQKHDRPFFLACGLHKPHMPWNVPGRYFDLFPLDQIQLPPHRPDDLEDLPAAGRQMATRSGDHARILASGRWKEAIQAYLAAIAYTDMNIGRLLEALDQSRYATNTLIVLWGDHGWHLGEKQHWRKFALWEEATRAPLVWVVPGLTRPNSVCHRTVDFMSVFPTLTDLCGIPTPAHLEGPSLRPLLANPQTSWDRPALTTFGQGNHAVRTEGWRYIRYRDGSEELYDETADPFEWTNLADKPEHAERKLDLARYLPK